MKVKNTDQELLQKLVRNDKTTIYASLVPYKGNTQIKVYDEEGNLLGDIPEEEISTYIDEEHVILFINEYIDDDTGLPIYILQTLV